MIQGLSQFSERFKSRILEMAEAEVNPAIQLQAVNVAISMSRAELLEDEDQDQLLSLIFNSNDQVNMAGFNNQKGSISCRCALSRDIRGGS
jgi:cohesin complex subunit SA-1/2